MTAFNFFKTASPFTDAMQAAIDGAGTALSEDRKRMAAFALQSLRVFLDQKFPQDAAAMSPRERQEAVLYLASILGTATARISDAHLKRQSAAIVHAAHQATLEATAAIIVEEQKNYYGIERFGRDQGRLPGNRLASKIATRINRRLAEAKLPTLKDNSMPSD